MIDAMEPQVEDHDMKEIARNMQLITSMPISNETRIILNMFLEHEISPSLYLWMLNFHLNLE